MCDANRSESRQRREYWFLHNEPVGFVIRRTELEIQSMLQTQPNVPTLLYTSAMPLRRLLSAGCVSLVIAFVLLILSGTAFGAASAAPSGAQNQETAPQEASGTSTDLFVMLGSDFDRPGLVTRANYNIGIGHTFGFLKKDPIGDELTFGYTYENSGSHGFLHTAFGEHTESAGIMRNFPLPGTKVMTGYTWLQSGVTSYTGNAKVENRLDSGVSLGAIIHFNNANSIWIQESYSKVVTVPWYTTTSIGCTYSW
jgi:hypothetical protein